MLTGFRRNGKNENAETGIIDIHSHILPGLDDGARSLEQSMEMVRIACEQGIRAVIATPHFMPEGRGPRREETEEAVELLSEEIAEAGYGLELYPGNELYFHEEALEQLEKGRLLPLAGSDCVLVEFSPMEDARYIRNALGRILSLGLTPVAAHVERYENIMKQASEQVSGLKDMGALIQVNASTVEGKFGKTAQKQVLSLLKRELVDFIGTDAHSAVRRAPTVQECARVLRKKCPEAYVRRLLWENAERLLLG